MSKSLFQDVRETLDSVTKDDGMDVVNCNMQQVKEHVRSVFSKHIHQLRLREQSLLNQADNMHECLNQVYHSKTEKLSEERGKLLGFLELCKYPEFKNSEAFHHCARGALKKYKSLLLNENSPSSIVSFDCDENMMSKTIQRFGKLFNSIPDCDGEHSDASWEFPLSETESLDLQVDHDGCHEKCAGTCASLSFDIEDVNKYFGKMLLKQEISMNDVCKANEVCSSLKECICDEPCHATHGSETNNVPINKFVNLVGNAMGVILDSTDEMEKCDVEQPDYDLEPKEISSEKHELFSFTEIIQDQILKIMDADDKILVQSNICSNSGKDAVTVPLFVGEISAEMSRINQQQKCFNNTENFPTSAENIFSKVSAQLNAILNDELPMFGVEDTTFFAKFEAKVGDVASSVSREKGDTEKKWSAVADDHEILLGVVDY
ncbi:unnamed protein product [Clavelina lepadiformis]|uniref:Uncharacterized protein n=1 Tax=Clavelina lepadiformis TaxID=159417 RepID=A0ABP0FJH0_CLALP